MGFSPVSDAFGATGGIDPFQWLAHPDGDLHLSLRRHGVPLLGGGGGLAGLSAEGEALVAGLLQELPALLPLACALGVSYRRLVPGRWAVPFQVWGVENREAALRLIPATASGEAAHLELKVCDLSANPHLLLGGVPAVVEAALRHPMPLPAPVAGDPGLVKGRGAHACRQTWPSRRRHSSPARCCGRPWGSASTAVWPKSAMRR